MGRVFLNTRGPRIAAPGRTESSLKMFVASGRRDTMEKLELVGTYRRRARTYDVEATLLSSFLGLRLGYHRRTAVRSLRLREGDTVVEVGCGTGANFEFLEREVGDRGQIIGVDLSPDMLREAEKRVRDQGWKNVELVNCDASSFKFPDAMGGVLSTFAISLIPDFDRVIRGASGALMQGRRFVIMDFKMPSNRLAKLMPPGLTRILVFLFIRPYGGTLEMSSRHPWESLARHLVPVSFTELWLGSGYVATAVRDGSSAGA